MYKDPEAELDPRVYAETTKMELAEIIVGGKKIILGIDKEICGTRHIKFIANCYGIKKVHSSMEGILEELKVWMERPANEHHLDAPLFDSEEELAKHLDMLAMNQTIMERWNKIVAPSDKVYVKGNMPESEWCKFINGEIL